MKNNGEEYLRNSKGKYGTVLLSVLFGWIVFLYFWLYYPGHLYYQEQFQLFLFDWGYWWQRVTVPGGVADYLSEFLIQFYYYAWAGALILALLFVAIQRLLWRLSRLQGASAVYYPFSFLPMVALWYFLCDENALLSYVVALLMALLAALAYATFSRTWTKALYLCISIPLLYWIAGPVHFVFAGWVILYEWQVSRKEREWFTPLLYTVVIGIWGIVCPLLSSLFLQYPLYRLMGGLNYYRFPVVIPLSEVGVAFVVMAFPLVLSLLPAFKRRVTVGIALQLIVLLIASGWLIFKGSDRDKEEAMMYDYLAKNERWTDLINRAEKRSPASPFTVTCLNLALAETGQLADRMFEFYQNGVEGLLPEFQRDFTSPLPTGEVFYHLGMINTAQRFAFEAMEAIPNFRKSSRCYKRLAETNLINGQYKVAAKYLHALCKTLFYRKWAENTLTYLYHEDRINAHKEWGWLRKLRYTDDFLFSDREVDIMLGLLFQHNSGNRMAFEYLLAYELEKKDLNAFLKYYPLGKTLGYDHIPRSYQEALVFVWTQQHSSFSGMPWSISSQVMDEVTEFARVYVRQKDAEAVLKGKYSTTFWYYLLFRK